MLTTIGYQHLGAVGDLVDMFEQFEQNVGGRAMMLVSEITGRWVSIGQQRRYLTYCPNEGSERCNRVIIDCIK